MLLLFRTLESEVTKTARSEGGLAGLERESWAVGQAALKEAPAWGASGITTGGIVSTVMCPVFPEGSPRSLPFSPLATLTWN